MSPLPKIIGGAFNLAGLVAPTKVGTALAKAFLTPMPRMDASIWPSELMAKSSEKTFTVAGHPLQSWKFGEGDKKAVFCHGWGGCGANSLAILPRLLEAGFEVHTFDGPGHGNGKLRPTNMLEFGEALNQLVESYGPFDAAIGHSFGGGAITLALGRGFEVDRAVLIAPMIDSELAKDFFTDMIGLSSRLEPYMSRALDEQFADYIEAWDLANWAKTYTTPARIFHDPKDRRVPYSAAARAAENWENCTITPMPGAGHQKILKDPTVIDDLIDFVSNTNTPA